VTVPVMYVAEIQRRAHIAGQLTMWTIYDHPSDFPNVYVARCHIATPPDQAGPTEHTLECTDLQFIRAAMVGAGLTCLMRAQTDDPKIVETWL